MLHRTFSGVVKYSLHIFAVWSQAIVTKYRWLWYDATTFEPYLEETSYENSLMTQQAGTLALRSMINVFKSLTPNAQNIFILMAKYHMDHCDNQSYIGKALFLYVLVLKL